MRTQSLASGNALRRRRPNPLIVVVLVVLPVVLAYVGVRWVYSTIEDNQVQGDCPTSLPKTTVAGESNETIARTLFSQCLEHFRSPVDIDRGIVAYRIDHLTVLNRTNTSFDVRIHYAVQPVSLIAYTWDCYNQCGSEDFATGWLLDKHRRFRVTERNTTYELTWLAEPRV